MTNYSDDKQLLCLLRNLIKLDQLTNNRCGSLVNNRCAEVHVNILTLLHMPLSFKNNAFLLFFSKTYINIRKNIDLYYQ